MRMTRLAVMVAFCVAVPTLFAGEMNVLVVGSTTPFAKESGVKNHDAKALVRMVQEDLVKDPEAQRKMNVVFEEVYTTRTLQTAYGGGGDMHAMEYHCHSLAQWYFWPEGRDKRLANLRGEGDAKWDYVLLLGDPYVMAKMPGMYAEGVKLIADVVRQGTAKPLLFVPWGSTGGAKPIASIACRVGKGAGIPVVPSSLAETLGDDLSGVYGAPNPFAMKYVEKWLITYNHTGSSSERGIERGLQAATKRCGVAVRRTNPKKGEPKIDFNYGRGNSNFEKNKRYKVAPDVFDRSYGFPMQDHSKSAAETLLYGIDRRFFGGQHPEDGTDLGIAWDMVSQDEVRHDIRCIPIRLLWAKLHEADPQMKPLRDRWHMSQYLDDASGTYIYTLLSGRCPIGEEPPREDEEAYRRWLGSRIGYETAWRMSHLNDRVPGYQVRPLGKELLGPEATTELEVKFHYPPKANVAVAITTDTPGAVTVSPAKLTFTPENHAAVQTVTVTAAKAYARAPVRIRFATTSGDPVFNQLGDAWTYTIAEK